MQVTSPKEERLQIFRAQFPVSYCLNTELDDTSDGSTSCSVVELFVVFVLFWVVFAKAAMLTVNDKTVIIIACDSFIFFILVVWFSCFV